MRLKHPTLVDDVVYRLRKRAEIRRMIPSRKSVQENKPDRIADLLVEAANEIEDLRNVIGKMDHIIDRQDGGYMDLTTKQELNEYLHALLGSHSLVNKWWETRIPKLGAAPSSIWETEPQIVINYVMKFAL